MSKEQKIRGLMRAACVRRGVDEVALSVNDVRWDAVAGYVASMHLPGWCTVHVARVVGGFLVAVFED